MKTLSRSAQMVWTVSVVLIFMKAGVADAEDVSFLGDEFQVNVTTTGEQSRPSVALIPDGRFIVVWKSESAPPGGTDADEFGIVGQRFDAESNLLGGEFQINSFTSGYQNAPRIAADAAGNFVVIWESQGSPGPDTDEFSVQGQRYDSNGLALGEQFQINEYTTGWQRAAQVAMGPAGDFIVVWQSDGSTGSDTDGFSIQGRRFDADGTTIGDQFQINTQTTANQVGPDVALGTDGEFIVAWESFALTNYDAIVAQRFSSDGSPLGDEILIENPSGGVYKFGTTVAIDPEGKFVVSWAESYSVSSHHTKNWIQVKTYDSLADEMASMTPVTDHSPQAYLASPTIALEPQGTFVVSWIHKDDVFPPPHEWLIEARRFEFDGEMGELFVLHDNSVNATRKRSSMSSDGQGRAIIAWDADASTGTDSSDFSIQARRFLIEPADACGVFGGDNSTCMMFADGFESGDTSGWDSGSP